MKKLTILFSFIFILIFIDSGICSIQVKNYYAHEAAKKGLISLSALSLAGIERPRIFVKNKTDSTLELDFSKTGFMPEHNEGQRIGLASKGKIKLVVPPHKSESFLADSRCLDHNRLTDHIKLKYSYLPDSIPDNISNLLSKNASQEDVWKLTDGDGSEIWKSMDPRNKELFQKRKKEIEAKKQLVTSSNSNLPVFNKIMNTLVSDGEINTIAFSANGATIIDEKNNFWSENIPEKAEKKLSELNKKNSVINSVAFNKNNGWVIIHDKNKVEFNNIPKELSDLLTSLSSKGTEIKKIAFTPKGGWILTYGFNGVSYDNFPVEVADLMENFAYWGVNVKTIAFTKDYGWLIIFGKNDFVHKGLPVSLAKKINELYSKDKLIKNVAFTPSGDWILTQK